MNDQITITLSFDEGYAEQATVMLYSLFENNASASLEVYAFYHKLNEVTRVRIQKNISHFMQRNITWVSINPSLISNFIIRKGHVNENTYSRIFMAEMLQGVNRFLYLDCDMLVLQSLEELWRVDLAGKLLGAIEDPTPFYRHTDLGIPKGKSYFNAGVLLVDAQAWRQKKRTEAVVNKLVELGGKAGFWDQDGLNATLYDEWMPLQKKWNIQSHDVMLEQEKNSRDVKASLAPAIIHFTGSLKPWNFKSTNPFKKDYYSYLKKTDFFSNHRPENRTAVNIIRRIVRNVFVYLRLLKM